MGCAFFAGFAMMGTAIAAPTRIDLQIESVQLQPPSPAEGKTVTAVAAIRNNGSEPAENFYLSASILKGGKHLKTIQDVPVLSRLPRLGSGLSVPVSLGVLPAGEYQIVVTVDASNAIEETNEGNNSYTKNFRVSGSAFGGSSSY